LQYLYYTYTYVYTYSNIASNVNKTDKVQKLINLVIKLRKKNHDINQIMKKELTKKWTHVT